MGRLRPQYRSAITACTAVRTINATVSGIEIHTIGWILLAVGAIGALFSLIFWSSWGGVGGPSDGRRRTVVREDY